MIKYDERFFVLSACRFSQKTKTLKLVFFAVDNFEPEIPKHESRVAQQILDELGEKVKIEFEYTIGQVREKSVSKNLASIEALDAYADAVASSPSTRIDKALPIHGQEYFLGMPIKQRPIKIKYLRPSQDLQVTAGTINFFKEREYQRQQETPNENGEIVTTTIKKRYWTFVLDDGADRVGCVFFPTAKTEKKFEKLCDKTVVAVIGTYNKRPGGDTANLRVAGVSFCEMG